MAKEPSKEDLEHEKRVNEYLKTRFANKVYMFYKFKEVADFHKVVVENSATNFITVGYAVFKGTSAFLKDLDGDSEFPVDYINGRCRIENGDIIEVYGYFNNHCRFQAINQRILQSKNDQDRSEMVADIDAISNKAIKRDFDRLKAFDVREYVELRCKINAKLAKK